MSFPHIADVMPASSHASRSTVPTYSVGVNNKGTTIPCLLHEKAEALDVVVVSCPVDGKPLFIVANLRTRLVVERSPHATHQVVCTTVDQQLHHSVAAMEGSIVQSSRPI